VLKYVILKVIFSLLQSFMLRFSTVPFPFFQTSEVEVFSVAFVCSTV